MVGQVHLRRGKALHPPQGLEAELGGELVLPGQQLQLEIGNRGGGGHRMAPEGAQKLHVGRQGWIGGQPLQGLEDVAATHLLEAPEQGAGVIEHDPRVAALRDQPGQDVNQASVTLGERLGVVVIALAGVIHHVLQMGDQLPVGTGGNGGLMHVQRTGKGRLQPLEPQRRALGRPAPRLLHRRLDLSLPASNGGQAVEHHGRKV